MSYADPFVVEVAAREFHSGMATGFLLGFFACCLMVAVVVGYALSEAGES